MAQWVRAHTTNPDDLTTVPRTHMVEENQLTQARCPLTYTAC